MQTQLKLMDLLLLLLIVHFVGFLPFRSESVFIPPPGVCPSCFHLPTINQSIDYGRIIQTYPASLFKPNRPRDISRLLKSINAISNHRHRGNITVGPNGARHSTHGQAQVPGGIVVDMKTLSTRFMINPSKRYIDVDAGALWVDVLEETLKYGLTPRSWTDYLYLTVGGTLSVGGVSGQAFRFGPQISNVLEMDVITGKGDMMTCSMKHNSELFYGVLGGLGQFGIITRARIILEVAPNMVKWINIPYEDFEIFTKDQEQLIAMEEPDYVEGFLKEGAQRVSYYIELALYYNEGDPIQQISDVVISRLSSVTLIENDTSDVTYFDFLNRVRGEELGLRKQGLWEVPHPWLSILVPQSQISNFNLLLLRTVAAGPINGPLIIYPVFTYKWNKNMSMMLPEGNETVVYVVSILRSEDKNCTTGSQCIKDVLRLNQDIVNAAVVGEGSMGAKEYLAYSTSKGKYWSAHFGPKWEKFKLLKHKFDPLQILSPGPGIFHPF